MLFLSILQFKIHLKQQFMKLSTYLHVYIKGESGIRSQVEGLIPVQSFCQYIGTDRDMIKKKYKRLVNKRRTKLVLAEAYQYMQSKEKPELKHYMNSQVLNEIDYMIHRMDLSPKVFLSYDRCAMFGKDNKDFRVTFDRNITTRRYDLGLHYGVYGDKLLEEDEWIMEVKIEKAMPLWMTQILSEFEIYPASFSKYGTEYKKFVANGCKISTKETE